MEALSEVLARTSARSTDRSHSSMGVLMFCSVVVSLYRKHELVR